MQLMLSICEDSNDAEIVNSILNYKIVSFFLYDESKFDINNLNSIERILIIIHIHALYQILLLCVQSIFVSLILKYVKKFLKSRSDDNSNRIRRKLNNEEKR